MTKGGTEHQARRSSAIVAVVMLAIGAWNLYRDRLTIALPLLGVAALLLILAAAVPAGAKLFYAGWMRVARLLAFVNTRILLFLLYYVVITPYGSLARLFGQDPLELKKKSDGSYWINRARKKQLKEQFHRLY